MRVLVTGATGVIGRRLLPLLRDRGHRVTALVRSDHARASFEREGIAPVALDLFDEPAVRRAVTGHDAVVNLATHMPRSSAAMLLPWAWRENDRLRQIASATISRACVAAGASRFVQESFAPVYPDCGDRWIEEATPLRPLPYNRTIADAEAAAALVRREGGTGIVLRFGAFYGADATQTADLVRWVKRGFAPLPGPDHAFISSISHDDAATAVAAALTLPAGTYNVVDDEPVTHREFVDALADALRVRRPRLPPAVLAPLFGSMGALLSRSLRISNRALRAASDWTPKYPSVREGWAALAVDQPGNARSTPAGTVKS